ncbi:hypothetical protein J8I29_12560 [Labrys sp. LIt4]|uniref:hypothetical protein n=1 Tax=Labrys sp. LIt4 TaxID=2821355 RepID=UPI001ADEE0F3|nr:hypothetical protein [Labrys sp. LIt4]MBP0580146.1 hypothetical protein [Labrys sp. LIt4]
MQVLHDRARGVIMENLQDFKPLPTISILTVVGSIEIVGLADELIDDALTLMGS